MCQDGPILQFKHSCCKEEERGLEKVKMFISDTLWIFAVESNKSSFFFFLMKSLSKSSRTSFPTDSELFSAWWMLTCVIVLINSWHRKHVCTSTLQKMNWEPPIIFIYFTKCLSYDSDFWSSANLEKMAMPKPQKKWRKTNFMFSFPLHFLIRCF